MVNQNQPYGVLHDDRNQKQDTRNPLFAFREVAVRNGDLSLNNAGEEYLRYQQPQKQRDELFYSDPYYNYRTDTREQKHQSSHPLEARFTSNFNSRNVHHVKPENTHLYSSNPSHSYVPEESGGFVSQSASPRYTDSYFMDALRGNTDRNGYGISDETESYSDLYDSDGSSRYSDEQRYSPYKQTDSTYLSEPPTVKNTYSNSNVHSPSVSQRVNERTLHSFNRQPAPGYQPQTENDNISYKNNYFSEDYRKPNRLHADLISSYRSETNNGAPLYSQPSAAGTASDTRDRESYSPNEKQTSDHELNIYQSGNEPLKTEAYYRAAPRSYADYQPYEFNQNVKRLYTSDEPARSGEGQEDFLRTDKSAFIYEPYTRHPDAHFSDKEYQAPIARTNTETDSYRFHDKDPSNIHQTRSLTEKSSNLYEPYYNTDRQNDYPDVNLNAHEFEGQKSFYRTPDPSLSDSEMHVDDPYYNNDRPHYQQVEHGQREIRRQDSAIHQLVPSLSHSHLSNGDSYYNNDRPHDYPKVEHGQREIRRQDSAIHQLVPSLGDSHLRSDDPYFNNDRPNSYLREDHDDRQLREQDLPRVQSRSYETQAPYTESYYTESPHMYTAQNNYATEPPYSGPPADEWQGHRQSVKGVKDTFPQEARLALAHDHEQLAKTLQLSSVDGKDESKRPPELFTMLKVVKGSNIYAEPAEHLKIGSDATLVLSWENVGQSIRLIYNKIKLLELTIYLSLIMKDKNITT